MALIATATTPFVLTAVSRSSAFQINEFPVPATAWGFGTLVEDAVEQSFGSAIIGGAVFPESKYLEPTIGQIWPR